MYYFPNNIFMFIPISFDDWRFNPTRVLGTVFWWLPKKEKLFGKSIQTVTGSKWGYEIKITLKMKNIDISYLKCQPKISGSYYLYEYKDF